MKEEEKLELSKSFPILFMHKHKGGAIDIFAIFYRKGGIAHEAGPWSNLWMESGSRWVEYRLLDWDEIPAMISVFEEKHLLLDGDMPISDPSGQIRRIRKVAEKQMEEFQNINSCGFDFNKELAGL